MEFECEASDEDVACGHPDACSAPAAEPSLEHRQTRELTRRGPLPPGPAAPLRGTCGRGRRRGGAQAAGMGTRTQLRWQGNTGESARPPGAHGVHGCLAPATPDPLRAAFSPCGISHVALDADHELRALEGQVTSHLGEVHVVADAAAHHQALQHGTGARGCRQRAYSAAVQSALVPAAAAQAPLLC